MNDFEEAASAADRGTAEATLSAGRLAAVIRWYQTMGCDAVVGPEPVDWLARGPVPPESFRARPPAGPATMPPAGGRERPQLLPQQGDRAAPPSTPGPTKALPPPPPAAGATMAVSDREAEANARAAAREARTLDALHQLLKSFDGCGLKATAKNLCFYRGAADARVMVIGEAPGRDEDRAGVPFVGRAGQLLDKMLAAIGLSEADTHITNVVYWRPPGNRVPTPQETLICRPFLERQIRLVQPELIVTVGGAAAKLVLETSQGIMKVRGKWGRLELAGEAGEAPTAFEVMPTLHPAYLLRSPAHKRQAWRDLLAIRAKLDARTAES
jgi:uracil-DNA glycosylase family 4